MVINTHVKLILPVIYIPIRASVLKYKSENIILTYFEGIFKNVRYKEVFKI